ncbi:sensor histidine kinase [Aurantibacter sp.]|uniref:tetratricopeptide repeat-containing sensor histidine kinase n=1 Tax=Aurantibacter sp. TaxID=2807103 RepID=UPI00326534B6
MKNQLFCLLFILLCSALSFGQTKEIDSLKAELLKSSIQDTTRIRMYMTLANTYHSYSVDSLAKYAKLGVKLSKLNNDYLLGRTSLNLGLAFRARNQMDSSRYYLNNALKIGKLKKDTLLLRYAYTNYALTLMDDTDFDEKVQVSLEVIKLAQDNNYYLAEAEYNLGVVYGNAGYDSLGLKYFKRALTSSEIGENNKFLSYTLMNLVLYSFESNNLDEAKAYLDKMSTLCEKMKLPKVCFNYYQRLGAYYDKVEIFDNAEKAYLNAIQEVENMNSPYHQMYSHISLGEHYVLAGNLEKAIQSFDKFEKINENNPTRSLEFWAFKQRAEAEKLIGNHEISNKYLEKYIKINDSLNSEKNKTSIANAEAKYQTVIKDKEIAEQKLALAESKSKTRTMNILIVSLLLGSILLWFSFRQRQKRMQQQLVTIEREQEVRTLESLMEGEEKERLRIAKELHDGVNGDLAAIKFKLASLLETNNQVINEAVAMIDTSSEQVRAISHNLVPPSLRDFNLLEAVGTYCENMNSVHQPEITFQHLGNAIVLNKKQEANLFRIVQELVTNSIKHAKAKEIHVQLSNVENNLQLTVEDDGKGFDENNVNGDGIGMQNVKSRVEYLNGLMDVKSDGKGTSITITITD